MLAKGREIMENLQIASIEMKKTKDQLVAELESSKKENKDLKKALTALTVERDTLQDEMSDAIILEHIRGFKKALRQMSFLMNVSTEGVNFDIRKDFYQGELVPIGVIPTGTFSDEEPEVAPAAVETTTKMVDATASGEGSEATLVHIN